MRPSVILGCVAAASACDPQQDGRWVVREGENFAEVAHALGVELDKLTKDNGVRDPDLIYAGNTFTVPYTASPKPPATWNIKSVTTGTQSGCLAYLELGPSTTFITQTKKASNSGAFPSLTQNDYSSPVTSRASPSESATSKAATSETPIGEATVSETATGTVSAIETTTGKGTQVSQAVESASTTFHGMASSQPAATSEASSATDCASQVWSTCTTATRTPVGTSDPPTSSSISIPEPLCVQELAEGRRGITDEGKQNVLAQDFCDEARPPFDIKNPSGVAQFYWKKEDVDKDSGFYFYSLLWTGWENGCSEPGSIDKKTCTDIMKRNFKKCQSSILWAG